jgi:hypothetical protein
MSTVIANIFECRAMGNRSIPIETKQAILEDAKKRILEGSTLDQIATSHGIDTKTLNTWLIALGDEYKELREAWIDNMLVEAKSELDNASDQFPLARAREQWKAATWYAERRDRLRYGQQTMNLNIINGVTLTDALQGEAGSLLEHISDSAKERK